MSANTNAPKRSGTCGREIDVLGERNNLASKKIGNRELTAQQSQHAIESQRKAAVRRTAKLQRLEQVREPSDLLFAESKVLPHDLGDSGNDVKHANGEEKQIDRQSR
jgi:hypothetical protein